MSVFLVGLNLRRQRVVIFGGGRVGEGRAARFSESAQEVLVVSRDFTDKLRRLGKERRNLQLIREEINRSSIEKYVSSAFIAVPATDDRQLNEEISKIAKERGVLVNRVDRPEETDLVVPAIVKRGDIQIAVLTGGKSPALSHHLREKLSGLITDEDLLLLGVQDHSRGLAKRLIRDQGDRKRVLYRILKDRQILMSLRRNDPNGAKARAEALIRDFAGGEETEATEPGRRA